MQIKEGPTESSQSGIKDIAFTAVGHSPTSVLMLAEQSQHISPQNPLFISRSVISHAIGVGSFHLLPTKNWYGSQWCVHVSAEINRYLMQFL